MFAKKCNSPADVCITELRLGEREGEIDRKNREREKWREKREGKFEKFDRGEIKKMKRERGGGRIEEREKLLEEREK